MAFKFWKRDEQKERDNNEQILGGELDKKDDALSDILQCLISGEGINREKALSIPAVASNVDFISGLIASMPVKLYCKEKTEDKKTYVEEIEDDKRTQLLNLDTGDTLDAYQLKKALVEDYLLGRGGYCYIDKSGNDIVRLCYVEDDFVAFDYNFNPLHKSYEIFVEGGSYHPFDFIKLLRNTKNGAWGVGLVEELNKAFETAYESQIFQLGLVKGGGNKKGFLKSERKLGKEEIESLKRAWKRLYANNSESAIVLNNGIDFKEASNTSVEMQLNESIDNLKNQIDDIFHVDKDNFYNTFKFALYPIIKAFETALNRDLLLEKEKGKLFFEFDVKEIIKADVKERYEVYKLAKEVGFMSKNEMRRAENLNRIEGLDVIDFGLGSVLYDTNTNTYYTPNTNSVNGGYTPEDVKEIEEESFIDKDNGTEV